MECIEASSACLEELKPCAVIESEEPKLSSLHWVQAVLAKLRAKKGTDHLSHQMVGM